MARIRFFSGLVATMAFALSFATGVGTSICAAEVELSGLMVVDQVDSGHASPGSTEHDCMGHEGPDDDGPYCPFGSIPTGATCATAASLPAPTAEVSASDEEALELAAISDKPCLLLGTVLFHPPRS